MFCKQCGEGIETQANFCPNCGQKLKTTAEPQQPTRKASKAGFWLKSIFTLLFIFGAIGVYLSISTAEPSETVENQLQALRNDHITEAYYHYTSKAFQDSVSLEHFRQFVQHYPTLTKYTAARYVQLKLDKNISALDVLLTPVQGPDLKIQYRLIKEGDSWKILGLKLEDPTVNEAHTAQETDPKVEAAPLKTEPFDSQPLLEVIQKQLNQIRQKNIEKAYSDYTSKDFQKTTTEQVFNNFIQGHPGFSDNKAINLGRIMTVDNNVVTFSGTLTTNTGHTYPVEYNLISEDGTWKILHIEVEKESTNPPKEVAQKAPLQFNKFVLGNQVNANGLVANPTVIFNKDSGQIHLNLYIHDSVAGTQIEVLFQHIESKSKAPLVTARVPDDGDEILSFAFSPPVNGWPKGHYQIEAKASSGEQGTVDFSVE